MALVERWDGTKWRLQATPRPMLFEHVVLQAVSCPSASYCVAVGYSYGSNSAVTLAERWNGRSWKVQPTPNGAAKNIHGNTDSGLYGVSCTSSTRCTAVGNSGAFGYTLAERWNGHRWKIQPSPNRVHPPANRLDAVSCGSVGECMALGISSDDYTDLPLVERWSDSAWTIQSVPDTGNGVFLSGVSCSSANACTAVGNNGDPLAERWNGTTWRIQHSARIIQDPGNTTGAGLNAVSCPSQNTCIAVGSTSLNSGGRRTVAEIWHDG